MQSQRVYDTSGRGPCMARPAARNNTRPLGTTSYSPARKGLDINLLSSRDRSLP